MKNPLFVLFVRRVRVVAAPIVWVGLSLAAQLPTTAHAAERELFLAGGALKVCSSLSPRECDVEADVVGPRFRGTPRYAIDAQTIEVALDPRLWRGKEAAQGAMRALLADAQGRFGPDAVEEAALRDLFKQRCVGTRDQVEGCRGRARSPWTRLDDDQQMSVLAALELPQFDDGVRRRERASLDHGRTSDGAGILRAFVAAATERAGGKRPSVAVVTASAFDPFDPVDFYLDALTEAGADVAWWPIDAPLNAAMFDADGNGRRDCDALSGLRLERLGLPARERIYPDLVAQQQRACEDPDALATLPQRVQGVFFSGGDQWKLRRAFFDAQDRPNPWLLALRDAVAKGDVVIGGTSAGSAVQSGGPMLSNGTAEEALKHGAIVSPPPASGCARSGDCIGGLDEDTFTFWPDGGLGLSPGMIVDTHFSERARELRLLKLLSATGTRFGIGADETSALHLRWRDEGTVDIRALGASGGWVFDASPGCSDRAFRAQAYYVAPGATLQLDSHGARWQDTFPGTRTQAKLRSAKDALDPGALRIAAQQMAELASQPMRFNAIRARAIEGQVSLSWTDATRVSYGAGAAYSSIGPLQIEVSPWAGCIADRGHE